MTQPILFFAAGLGTRMRHLVVDQPKPLVKVGSKALIDHALGFADAPDLQPKVVNLHYKSDMLRAHLGTRNIVFSDETDKLRETGGGLKHALPLLGTSPVITMNTDAVWRGANPIEQLRQGWQPQMEALLLMVPKENVHGHLGKGDFLRSEDGRLRRGPGDIYTGVQMIRTETLADMQQDAFSMNVIWDQIADRGGLYGLTYQGQWCDVGQPAGIPIAEEMLGV
ncbi:nucleotidyltransferase family protein [Yoonia sp. SS1-5]|uniref:Nucleotidyltransferase family protein n=1 Tax=Yoonia rhodophyticola TaxID=3137370 RepID=A0AAN0MAV4_9RHOB